MGWLRMILEAFEDNSIRFSIHYTLFPHFDHMELDWQLFQAPLSMRFTRVVRKSKSVVTSDGSYFGFQSSQAYLQFPTPFNQLMIARRYLWLLFGQNYCEISVFQQVVRKSSTFMYFWPRDQLFNSSHREPSSNAKKNTHFV